MISLPQMRALHRLYPDLCVLHLDAHPDAYLNERDRYNPGTTFTCAAEEVRYGAWAVVALDGSDRLSWVESGYQAMRERLYGATPN
jgi:arginase family enzyme